MQGYEIILLIWYRQHNLSIEIVHIIKGAQREIYTNGVQ